MCSRADDPSQHDRAPLPEPEPREGWPPAAALRAETTCRACGDRAYSGGPYLSDRCYGCDRHPLLCSCRTERQRRLDLLQPVVVAIVRRRLARGRRRPLELAGGPGHVVNRSLREWLDERAEEVRSGRPARR